MATDSSPLPVGTVALEPSGSFGRTMLKSSFVLPIPIFFCALFLGGWWALALAVALAGIVLLVSKDAVLAAMRWNQPSLQVSSTPFALGSTPTVVYRREPKRLTDISSCAIECLLVCEEQVTYQQGTDTRTDNRRVYERRCDGTGQGTARGLVGELELEISANMGAPSLALEHNQVTWFVEIGVAGTRLPRDAHTFTIRVAPVLDPTHQLGLQDT